MKNIYLLLASVYLQFSNVTYSQVIVFSDDFENGMTNWEVEATWGTTDNLFFSPTFSLSDSPNGDYAPNQNESITLTNGVDLSMAQSAMLSFQSQYDIEDKFDFCFIEGSWDDGNTWIEIASITDQSILNEWVRLEFPLAGFAGESNALFRFRINSDPGGEYDGIYIDDFEITSLPYDSIGPLIVYEGPKLYEGTADDFVIEAIVKDASSLSEVSINYIDSNENLVSSPGENIGNDIWRFVIPPQELGFQVDFSINAIDNSPAANSSSTQLYKYIVGEHQIFDDCSINSINSFGSIGVGGNACAVRFILENERAVFGLIRNYTDPYRPNNDMEVHVWKGMDGFPAEDLIEPIVISPEATLADFTAMTRIDLRDSQDLWQLEGGIFFGFTVTEGEAWVPITAYGTGNQSYIQNNNGWIAINDDFHFRLVTGPPLATNTDEFVLEEVIEIFPNPTSDYLFAHFENGKHPKRNISISDAVGNLIHQVDAVPNADQWSLDIRSWPKGVYFISFHDQKNIITRKFIKG